MTDSPADRWAAQDREARAERQRKINIALTGFADEAQTDGYHGTYDDWAARAYRAEARIEDLEKRADEYYADMIYYRGLADLGDF